MKKLLVVLVLVSLSLMVFGDWLVEVKVEGMEYEHNAQLEMALLLETIHNDVAVYDNTDKYLWKTPENPNGSYNIERWDQLQDLVTSLLHREGYSFVGIYTKNWTKGNTLVPFIYIEDRFTEPDAEGNPENIRQRNFDLVKNESLLAKAFNDGQGYFTTNAGRLIEKGFGKNEAREYQLEAGVRGYFAYPLKNGETTIGLLVVATKEPGLTEDQFFRIKQYGEATVWLVVQTVDLLAHPEKLGY